MEPARQGREQEPAKVREAAEQDKAAVELEADKDAGVAARAVAEVKELAVARAVAEVRELAADEARTAIKNKDKSEQAERGKASFACLF